MISNQSLTCPKGTSRTFEIDMDTGSDLTGATAQWALCESWFDQAKVYLTKTGVGDGLFINQDAGVWKITVNIAPSDTLGVPSGLLYHDCKVLLQSGDVEDVANGPFFLDPSVNILDTNAPITRNVRGTQILGSLGQASSLAVGQLSRNLSVAQSLAGLGQNAVAAHAASWVGPTWSPTDHSEFYTISGTNNEISTRSNTLGGLNTIGRSDTAQTTGTRDVFILVGLLSGDSMVYGIANGAEGTNVGAAGNNSIGYWSAGSTLINGGFGPVSPPTWGTGDTIGLRIDLDANTIAYNKNGGAWSATEDISPLRPSGEPIFVAITLTGQAGDYVSFLNQ